MAAPKKRIGSSTPGAKLINKGGASTTPNVAAKKSKGGSNVKGTKKR